MSRIDYIIIGLIGFVVGYVLLISLIFVPYVIFVIFFNSIYVYAILDCFIASTYSGIIFGIITCSLCIGDEYAERNPW